MRAGRDTGMVTAEIAVAMPVLMVLLAAALGAVAVIGGQLRCVDAAREAARALARGESIGTARSLASETGPRGAILSTTSGRDQIRATVQARIRPAGGLLPAFSVSAEAVALPEPTGPEPAGAVSTGRQPAGAVSTGRQP